MGGMGGFYLLGWGPWVLYNYICLLVSIRIHASCLPPKQAICHLLFLYLLKIFSHSSPRHLTKPLYHTHDQSIYPYHLGRRIQMMNNSNKTIVLPIVVSRKGQTVTAITIVIIPPKYFQQVEGLPMNMLDK